MSHWFSVETVFKSESSIKAAATSMGFILRHRAKCRGYSSNVQNCDLVLELPGGYDLGFVKQPDGTYVVSADFWQDHISKYLGNPTTMAIAHAEEKELYEQGKFSEADSLMAKAKISKFTQEYNKYALKELVQQQGLQYMESTLCDGSIVMEIIDPQKEAGERIFATLGKGGTVKVDAQGYTGTTCKEATKFLETLGIAAPSATKPEYYENPPLLEGVKIDG